KTWNPATGKWTE
nr:Chain A, HP7 [synthetic construct]